MKLSFMLVQNANLQSAFLKNGIKVITPSLFYHKVANDNSMIVVNSQRENSNFMFRL